MSQRKKPPRLYFDKGRKRWTIRYEGWMRRTQFELEQKDQAQALLDHVLGANSWVHAVRSLRPRERKPTRPPWARSKQQGVVYFVSAEGPHYPIKIGFSSAADVSKRLGELQIGNPSRLTVIATHTATYAQEQKIHSILFRDRLVGEWFLRTSQVIACLRAAEVGKLAEWLDDVHYPFRSDTVQHAEIN